MWNKLKSFFKRPADKDTSWLQELVNLATLRYDFKDECQDNTHLITFSLNGSAYRFSYVCGAPKRSSVYWGSDGTYMLFCQLGRDTSSFIKLMHARVEAENIIPPNEGYFSARAVYLDSAKKYKTE